jgi:hypothetical protein
MYATCLRNFHNCTVHFDIIKSFVYPTDAQLDCSKKMLKMYSKIHIKSAPTCFGLTNYHPGAYCLCFAKVTVLVIVTLTKHKSKLPDDGLLNRNM